jgi:hypothetical protein
MRYPKIYVSHSLYWFKINMQILHLDSLIKSVMLRRCNSSGNEVTYHLLEEIFTAMEIRFLVLWVMTTYSKPPEWLPTFQRKLVFYLPSALKKAWVSSDLGDCTVSQSRRLHLRNNILRCEAGAVFFFSPTLLDRLWDPPSHVLNSCKRLCSRECFGRSMQLTIRLHSGSWLENLRRFTRRCKDEIKFS